MNDIPLEASMSSSTFDDSEDEAERAEPRPMR
jgi:hypothetical protein